MSRQKESHLPAYLDPEDTSISPHDRANMEAALGGDMRRFKLNHVMVSSETIRQIDDCLRQRRHGTEFVKMYSGSFRRRRREMREFVDACQQHDVIPYVGGGATETAIKTRTLPAFVRELQGLGIDTIEISNSDGNLPASELAGTIAGLRRDFTHVLVEIGAKEDGCYQTAGDWIADLDAALENDADHVILEGTGSGRSGIYDSRGMSNSLLVTALADRAGERIDRFLIEAPYEEQRLYWMVGMFGWNIRLGNMPLVNSALSRTEQMRVVATDPAVAAKIAARRQAHRDFYAELLSICADNGMAPDRAIFAPLLQGLTADSLTEGPWRRDLRNYVNAIASIGRQSSNHRSLLSLFFPDLHRYDDCQE